MCTLNGRVSGKRLFGKLSLSADSGKAGRISGNHGCRELIIAATQTGPDPGVSVTLRDDPVDTALAARMPPDDVYHEDEEHDNYTTINPSNAAAMTPDDVDHENDACTTRNPSNSVKMLPDDVHHEVEGHDAYTTSNPPNIVTMPPHDVHHKVQEQDAYTTSNPSKAGKVRRFSLDQPGFLKTVQEARTLTPLEQERLKLLMKFKLTHDNLNGPLVIRAMRTEQLKELEHLLTDSYSEVMWGPLTYRPVLAWILATYLRDRQACLPHAVTLVGLYVPSEEIDDDNDSEVPSHKWLLAGAVEISFNASGKPKDLQTPVPPKDAPFLSNMAVLKKFRRRGIGRELLKAAEQLAVQMGCKEMYLHCRLIDEAPLNMYKKSGYAVVETDSILSLLTLQRRRHLMCKTLPVPLCDGDSVQSD